MIMTKIRIVNQNGVAFTGTDVPAALYELTLKWKLALRGTFPVVYVVTLAPRFTVTRFAVKAASVAR